MIDSAVGWIRRSTVPGKGIIVHSRQRIPYPEVSGYYIPTLIDIGERDLARQYASWLCSVQLPDGSIGAPSGTYGFAFDTGQVVRGFVAILPQMPEVETSLRRACDWLIGSADAKTGRLLVPPPGRDWSLGERGEVNEGIHLYCLWPIRQAGELLNERRYVEFADRSASYYLKRVDLTTFERPNALGHFFAYIQEALAELGYLDVARRGLASIAKYQRPDGSVPGYFDVPWICSTALAQLAKAWYAIGETDRADRALAFMSELQNASGGFFGSYGVRANYFPSTEIAWAAKYYVDAQLMRIARHFDVTVGQYSNDIATEDARVLALIEQAGDLNGRTVLDAGCGKGRFAALLKQRYPGADITAMDISCEMLKHVPAGIRTVQNGILSMPFAAGAFDLVMCIEALEHVVQIDAGIQELSRVVAPGGQLIVIDKNKTRLGALQMPDWEKWFGRDELVEAMARCGLQAAGVEIEGDGRACPQGLFLLWSGRRPAGAASAAPEPCDEACGR